MKCGREPEVSQFNGIVSVYSEVYVNMNIQVYDPKERPPSMAEVI